MKKFIAITATTLLVGMGAGAWVHDAFTDRSEPVAEVYTVQPGDTLWSIATEFQAKDCRNIYLPEFKDEIEQLNPILKRNKGYIQPGDKIQIVYMTRN